MTRRISMLPAAIALLLAGCSSSTVLEGEKFYIRSGIGLATLPRDISTVNEAAGAALREDLGYEIVSHEFDLDSGVLQARGSRQKTVKVQTWAEGEDRTKMQISMGIKRSDLVIRNIMSKIEARLQ